MSLATSVKVLTALKFFAVFFIVLIIWLTDTFRVIELVTITSLKSRREGRKSMNMGLISANSRRERWQEVGLEEVAVKKGTMP